MGARSEVMVGRDAELATLLETFQRAESGEAQVAVVTGEAGIGKTRLVREFVARLPDETVVAFGHAVPLSGGTIPYGVVADLFRSVVREAGAERVRAVLAERSAALSSLVPSLGVSGDAPSDRLATFGVAQDLLAELSVDRSLVLVIEDAHWADQSSVDLVSFLSRTSVRGRLLFLVTSRNAGGVALELRRLPNASAVELRGLRRHDIETQVRAIGGDVSAKTLSEIATLSDGVPLFVEELVSGGTSSTSLRLDLSARLSDLTPPTAELTRLAALESRPFRADLLGLVAERGIGEVEIALDEAMAAGLVEPTGSRWQFHHELLRLSVAATVRDTALVDGHRRWAEALGALDEAQADDLVAAADHADQALPPQLALEARVTAARACERVARGEVSAAQWRNVLTRVWNGDGAIPEGEHEEALLGVGAGIGGWPEVAEIAAMEAASTSSRGEMREVWLTLTQLNGAWSMNQTPPVDVSTDELARIMERVASVAPRPFTLRMLRLLSHSFRYLDDVDRANEAADLALQVAGSISVLPPGAVGWTIEERLANLEQHSIDIDKYAEVVQHGLSLIPPGDFESRALLHARAAAVHHERLDLIQGLQEATRAVDLARTPELSGFVYYISVGTRQELDWYLGRWDEVLQASPLLLAPGFADATNSARFMTFLVTALRGEPCDPGQTSALFEDARQSAHDRSTAYASRHLPAVMQAIAGEHVDPAAAREALAPCLQDEALRVHHMVADILALAARLDDGRPDLGDYRRTVSRASERSLADTPFESTFARLVSAEIDTDAEPSAVITWSDLVSTFQALPAPWYAAWCGLRLADALIRADDRDGAADALASALASAETLRALPLADQIRGLAARARLRLPGHEPSVGDTGPLTAREHEVLQLVVQGMTNDQIGGALFMSPKTVSVHVSHILAKLGAANRTEVAAVAHRRGLVIADS